MAIFEDITLTWNEREYKVPASRVLKCIAAIEDVLPLWKLASATVGDIKLASIAQAFGAALRFAGANVTDDEVYSKFFDGDGPEIAARARTYCFTLQALMIPPSHLRAKEGDVAGKGAAAAKTTDSLPPHTS